MTSVLFKKKDDKIIAFDINGHAGYASEGEDIVCAAISALSQSVIIGLEEVLYIKPDYNIKDGFLCMSIRDNSIEDIEKSQVLLKTFLKSLQSISVSYVGYITIQIEEV
ncbi:ribosomal-processing cysteine protease Prp [Clostridium sp. MSJ-4]|uniref:Ribosomal processing cysteine protease Prp n=1 Tax=Clostridium simiarum TaxID=2841506 RepID=A0ABS6F2J0_9CLOT|nr:MULTISPECIES: ribosomal-processing cysteine protease Prp [Clostridium]MBU5592727.1 ribosomal-processing cysteine protease Prp [Clostridium simiarum]